MADVRSNGERILVVIALTCVLSGACVLPFFTKPSSDCAR